MILDGSESEATAFQPPSCKFWRMTGESIRLIELGAEISAAFIQDQQVPHGTFDPAQEHEALTSRLQVIISIYAYMLHVELRSQLAAVTKLAGGTHRPEKNPPRS